MYQCLEICISQPVCKMTFRMWQLTIIFDGFNKIHKLVISSSFAWMETFHMEHLWSLWVPLKLFQPKFYSFKKHYYQQDRAEAYADTLHESTDELFRLLKLLDYSKGHTFISLNDRSAKVLLEATKQKHVKIINHDVTLTYMLPKEDALKFSIQWVIIIWNTITAVLIFINLICLGLRMASNWSHFQRDLI